MGGGCLNKPLNETKKHQLSNMQVIILQVRPQPHD